VIISRQMNHPNVLRIEGVAMGLFECCTVSRWMDCNVLEYIWNRGEPIDRLELVGHPITSMVCRCVHHDHP